MKSDWEWRTEREESRTDGNRDESGVEWGDWLHAESEVSTEWLYARLACSWLPWTPRSGGASVPGSFLDVRLLRELSNDVVSGCNRGDSSDIRRAALLSSAGRHSLPSVTPPWDIITSSVQPPRSFQEKYLCHAFFFSFFCLISNSLNAQDFRYSSSGYNAD